MVAAAGAIIGDNAGYWLGRKGGRALLRRLAVLRDYFERRCRLPSASSTATARRRCSSAVSSSLLRITAAWLAGISHMPWWRFLFWNAAGGIVWATSSASIAYYFGRAAAEAINHYGLYAGIGRRPFCIVGCHRRHSTLARAQAGLDYSTAKYAAAFPR